MDAATLNYIMDYYDSWVGVPTGTLRAIAKKESSYNEQTGAFRNSCNWFRACGLMQLKPNALADIKRVFGVTLNPLDPIQAIAGAACMFVINKMYIEHYTGITPDLWALVVAYNGGYTQGIKYMQARPIGYEQKNYLFAVYANMYPYG